MDEDLRTVEGKRPALGHVIGQWWGLLLTPGTLQRELISSAFLPIRNHHHSKWGKKIASDGNRTPGSWPCLCGANILQGLLEHAGRPMVLKLEGLVASPALCCLCVWWSPRQKPQPENEWPGIAHPQQVACQAVSPHTQYPKAHMPESASTDWRTQLSWVERSQGLGRRRERKIGKDKYKLCKFKSWFYFLTLKD